MSTSSFAIETSNLDQGLWSVCETLLHCYLQGSWRDSRYRSNDILYLPLGPSLTSLSDNCHSGQVDEVDRHWSLWILLSRRFIYEMALENDVIVWNTNYWLMASTTCVGRLICFFVLVLLNKAVLRFHCLHFYNHYFY